MHYTRTGYERHVKKYDSPVQSRADICRGAEGADGVDLGGKTIVVTGYVPYLKLQLDDASNMNLMLQNTHPHTLPLIFHFPESLS